LQVAAGEAAAAAGKLLQPAFIVSQAEISEAAGAAAGKRCLSSLLNRQEHIEEEVSECRIGSTAITASLTSL